MNDLEDIYGNSTGENRPQLGQEDSVVRDADMEDDRNAGDSSDSSDSDIEFVISTKAGQRAEAPVTKAQPYAAIKIQRPGASNGNAASPTKKEPVAKLPDVDVDAIADLDGKSILEIDLETLENKPWRQPGADITEYFNYGFDEFTWTAYCQKQTSIRTDYAPNKVMEGMMGAMDPSMMGPMGAGLMMPPMDPNLMSQMYGQMNMDFLQPPPSGFGSQLPQNNFNNRSAAPGMMGPARDSPMSMHNQGSDHRERDDSLGPSNIPKGPAQSRNNYRNRGGSTRW